MDSSREVGGDRTVQVVAREEPGPEALHAWDLLVDRTSGTDVTQFSVWGELRSRVGFTPIYLLAYQAGELVGGAQILTRRFPVLGSVGYLPYGPLVSPDAVAQDAGAADDIVQALIDALVVLSRRRLRILFIQPPEGAEATSNELLRRGPGRHHEPGRGQKRRIAEGCRPHHLHLCRCAAWSYR